MHKALGQLSTIHYGKSPSEVFETDGAFPVIGTGGEYGRACKSLFKEGVVVPRKGSLGNPQLAQQPFWPTDTTFAVVANQNVDVRWLYYSLLQYDLTRLNEATGVPSISREWLEKLKFFHPEYNNQKAISEILATIDRAIEKTEALIEKYQQIKAGLMHDLFTRGIGPDGKLRPPCEQAPELYQETPIGWIPKEWIFSTCATVCEKIIDCKNRTPPITPDGHPVIRTPNVRNGRFVDDELVYTDAAAYLIWTARGKPIPGDIVITREAPVGEVCKIPDRHAEACLGQRMMLYRTDSTKIDNNYFLYALQSRAIQNRLDLISGGSTVGHVRVGDIRDLWIYYSVSKGEQALIAGSLERISRKIQCEEMLLDKLQKKKRGLMHDLLTGETEVKVESSEVDDVA